MTLQREVPSQRHMPSSCRLRDGAPIMSGRWSGSAGWGIRDRFPCGSGGIAVFEGCLSGRRFDCLERGAPLFGRGLESFSQRVSIIGDKCGGALDAADFDVEAFLDRSGWGGWPP